MIEYIKGELTELTPATAVVEAAGVGYALNISLNTYSTIQGKKEVKLYVHENLVTAAATTPILSTALPHARSATSTDCSSPYREWAPTRRA